MFVVSYWSEEESESDSIDYDISVKQFLADLICGDLVFTCKDISDIVS